MTVTNRLEAGSGARLLVILLAAVLALAMLPLAGTASADHTDNNGQVIEQDPDPEAELIASTRFRGEQRFATAGLIGTHTWDENERAIIARHDEWPDALAGGYLAGVFDAPVLLVSQNNLQEDTLIALEALGVNEITLLGGTQAIGAANETELGETYDVSRISGETRFETAAGIATESGVVGEIDGRRTAFVATGINFADALTAGPLAYDGNFPILLTPSQSLHPATEQALVDLEIEHVIVTGGTNAVAAAVADEIRDVIEGDEDSITRLSGTTRIETAAAVAGFALGLEELDFTPFEHGWARGNEFADALTIGPRLGEIGGPLLLVPTPTLVDSAEGTNAALAEEVGCFTSRIDIAGGFAAISEEVEEALRGALACPDEPINVSLEADPESAETGEAIEVTASVSDNVGNPVEGVDVDLTAETDSATVVFDDDTVTTDADGTATTNATSATPGLATLIGTVTRDEVEFSGFVDVEWTLEGQTSAFGVALSSEQETDEDTAALDPPVTGVALLFLNSDDGVICWGIRMDPTEHDIGSYEAFGAVNAHIHVGEAGTDGGVVVPLGQVQDDTLVSIDCDPGADAGTLSDIEDDPAGYYVNVHTQPDYPDGVARGQLAFDDE